MRRPRSRVAWGWLLLAASAAVGVAAITATSIGLCAVAALSVGPLCAGRPTMDEARIIARHDRQHLLAMKLTSRGAGPDRVDVGSGAWDRNGRKSWVDVAQLYRVHPAGVRREAARLPRDGFDRVSRMLVVRHGWRPAD